MLRIVGRRSYIQYSRSRTAQCTNHKLHAAVAACIPPSSTGIAGHGVRFLSSMPDSKAEPLGTYGEAIENTSVWHRNSNPDNEFSIDNLFLEHLDAKSNTAITNVPTGSYVSLSEDEISKHFPEGFAGDTTEEFKFSGENRWMVRDTGKFLCRLIDDFGNNNNTGSIDGKAAIQLAGLTDRPEWHDTVMTVEHFGHELMEKTRPNLSKATSPHMNTKSISSTTSTGSVAEEYLDKLGAITAAESYPNKVLLTGPRGVGKSMALNQAVLHARRNGWLCLFVPEGWRQVQCGSYVDPAVVTMTGPGSSMNSDGGGDSGSTSNQHVSPGEELEMEEGDMLDTHASAKIYDNHEMSVEVLRGFWRAHKEQLRNISIRDPATILDKYAMYREEFKEAVSRVQSVASSGANKKLSFVQLRALIEGEDNNPETDKLDADVLAELDYLNFEPSSLEDLVVLGVALKEIAGSLFMDLVDELRALETIRVLIVVDQYNCWEVPSAFSYRHQTLRGKDLCVPHALNFLSFRKSETAEWTMKNGLCIAATSQRYAEGRNVDFSDTKRSLPLAVTVPAYSSVEYLAAAAYYAHRQVLPPRGILLEDWLGLRMFTGSNPRLLRVDSFSFLMPRIATYMHEENIASGGSGGGAVSWDVGLGGMRAQEAIAMENTRLGRGGGYDDDDDDQDDDGSISGRGEGEDTSLASIMDDIAGGGGSRKR